MSDYEIGALVVLVLWGGTLRWAGRQLGWSRALWLVGILFFLAIRLMIGIVRTFRDA